VALVRRERRVQPRLGARKLLVRLGGELAAMGVQIGRDRLLELLGRHDLLIKRARRVARTTDARHSFRVYRNRFAALSLSGPHQAWVSDITYVRTDEGFLYVSLISDAWSRKIVGYEGADTLEASGSLRALNRALGQLPARCRPMHHSDRGIQYACGDYVRRLESAGLEISMTEEAHCYENAQAERLNGILKQEYGLGGAFRTRAQARAALRQAVWLYNTQRPHIGLGYRTPEAVHQAA